MMGAVMGAVACPGDGFLLLDTTYDISTPEGVELHLPLAGLASRSLAWLVDGIVKLVFLAFVSIVTTLFGAFGSGLYLVFLFVVFWFYNVLFEVFWQGATPGKRAFGLAVMNVNGTPVGWSSSIIRNLIRTVDLLPGCYAFGCVAVLLSGRFQRLGDLAAGTVVVYRTPQARTQPAAGVEPRPLTVALSLDEQQALLDYNERAPRLHPDRARELATLLVPVLGPVDTERLRAYASWLAGRDRPA